eukprot:CAMPEP_0178717604 /NCGR_PEP_ID=MMETSP0699-20121125/22024_1 /TAXON_ID=265572 /ORGANISM="Extubocellulus spinifer, Strain CCMP396" /LENGTH=35 /DNA_ID= /DNA_START= /DNA_END= /DNA_ORIENTATION=
MPAALPPAAAENPSVAVAGATGGGSSGWACATGMS